MANVNQTQDSGGNGPGDGPFPIPSVGGAPSGPQGDYPGTQEATRAAEALIGEGGITDLCLFAQECLKDLPKKVYDAKESDADLVELMETRLDILQALRKIQRLAQKVEMDMEVVANL